MKLKIEVEIDTESVKDKELVSSLIELVELIKEHLEGEEDER